MTRSLRLLLTGSVFLVVLGAAAGTVKAWRRSLRPHAVIAHRSQRTVQPRTVYHLVEAYPSMGTCPVSIPSRALGEKGHIDSKGVIHLEGAYPGYVPSLMRRPASNEPVHSGPVRNANGSHNLAPAYPH
jgi:hypothetical protein